MQAREIMTADPACCTPQDTAREAARMMIEHDCGCLPVVDDMGTRHLVGVVTDRDLAARGIAEGKGPDTPVQELMSSSPSCCTPEADIGEVEQIMAERQVRRVPVIDERGCCVGMIAQADLARSGRDAEDGQVRRTVERISEPSRESRSHADVGQRPDAMR